MNMAGKAEESARSPLAAKLDCAVSEFDVLEREDRLR
jgi:hypothetical protein